MKKVIVIEKCNNCEFYKLYSEFHNLLKPTNSLISVCTKGNFVINGYKKLDEIDSIAQVIHDKCPLEDYE
jgi:hypothetical protein